MDKLNTSFNFSLAIIDDEPDITRLYQLALSPICSVRVFNDPNSFIAELQSGYSPQVVVTDLSMPHMSGIEMVQKARDLGRVFHTLMISGYLDKEKAIQVANLGQFQILEKPAPTSEIISSVKVLLMREELRKINEESKKIVSKMTEMQSFFRILCFDKIDNKTNGSAPPDIEAAATMTDGDLLKLEEQLYHLRTLESELLQSIPEFKKSA